MPLPKPSSGEDKKKFISRCMANPTMNSEYSDSKQRYTVCLSSWKKESITMRLKNLVARLKAVREKKPEENLFHIGPIVLMKVEAFSSLRDKIRAAVKAKFGKDSYVQDFSNKEVIVGFYTDDAIEMEEEPFKKVSYKVNKDGVTLGDDVADVTRKTTYERSLEAGAFIDLVMMECIKQDEE